MPTRGPAPVGGFDGGFSGSRSGGGSVPGGTPASQIGRPRIRQWRDENRDGRDDATGLDRVTFGQRMRDDMDAQAEWDARTSGEAASAASGNPYRRSADDAPGAQGGAEDGLSDYDRDMAGNPLGWLTGADARRDAARADDENQRNRQDWLGAIDTMPGVDDLAVDYEQSGFVDSEALQSGDTRADAESIEAQMSALRAMQGVYEQGGLTSADRSRMALGRQEIGRDVRAQREADQQALQARGMAGSGQGVASMLAGQQYGAQALSTADHQMQIAAQQRALQAMQQSGSMASQARGQSFGEDAHRRGAIDDWNRGNTEYRRSWTEGNTDRRNQTRESRADANQTNYQNNMQAASGLTGNYQAGQDSAQQGAARSDDANQRFYSTTGTLLSGLVD